MGSQGQGKTVRVNTERLLKEWREELVPLRAKRGRTGKLVFSKPAPPTMEQMSSPRQKLGKDGTPLE